MPRELKQPRMPSDVLCPLRLYSVPGCLPAEMLAPMPMVLRAARPQSL